MNDAPTRTIHAFHTYGEALREPFAAAFPEREFVVWTREEEFVAGLADVEILLAFRAPRDHWHRARRLRLIQTTGAGVDAVLPAPDLPDGVQLANARGIHEPEMSEFVLALILALAKRIPRALSQQTEREWRLFGNRRLAGKTLAVLGLGTIGRGVAQRGVALGMRVIGTKRTPGPVAGVDEVLPPSQTRRVLEQADVAVVILPLTAETRGLIDAQAIAAMKPGAHLVNVARGGIVDEAAVAKALRERSLGAAAFDVFAEEPLPQSRPLWDTPNLMITPHLAGISRDYMARLGEIFFENIRRLERGQPLLNPIDRRQGY